MLMLCYVNVVILKSIYYKNSTFNTTQLSKLMQLEHWLDLLKGQIQLNNRTEINTHKELKRTSNLINK